MAVIKILKEEELVGGSSNEALYPITHAQAVYDKDNNKLQDIIDGLGKFKKSFVSNTKVGWLNAGHQVNEGDSIEELLYNILYGTTPKTYTPATLSASLSTDTNVEIGTKKGTITYTINNNDNGPVNYVKYNDTVIYDAINKIGSNPFVDNKAVRVLSTEEDEYFIHKEIYTCIVQFERTDNIQQTSKLSTIEVNPYYNWYIGTSNTVPTTAEEIKSLTNKGNKTGDINLTFNDWKVIVICMPSNMTLESMIDTTYNINMMSNPKTFGVTTINDVSGLNNQAPTEYKVYYYKSKASVSKTNVKITIK